jgi:hypothetical protein
VKQALVENTFSQRIILEGEYFNCAGKVDKDNWTIHSNDNLSKKQLIVKKGDKDCRLNVTLNRKRAASKLRKKWYILC